MLIKSIDKILKKKNPDFSRSNLTEVRKELRSLGVVNFLPRLFETYANGIACDVSLMLIDEWAELSYSDFRKVIKGMSKHEIALIHFIPFMGMCIGIDLRKEIKQAASQEVYEHLVRYIGTEGPTALFYRHERHFPNYLEHCELTSDYLRKVKDRLIAEGATEAVGISGEISLDELRDLKDPFASGT